MAIIRRSGKVQLPFRQRQLRKHRDNKRAARQAAGITKVAKPKPTAAQRDFLYEQAQNRAWLEAQRQIKGHGINPRMYKELIRLFSYKTETQRHAPAQCIEGVKLSDDSRAVWDRLKAERADALLAQGKTKRAKKWWVSESEKRKVMEALEKLEMGDEGGEGDEEKPKRRKKTYKEVKKEKHAAFIAAKIKESREARAAGGYEMMEVGEMMGEAGLEKEVEEELSEVEEGDQEELEMAEMEYEEYEKGEREDEAVEGIFREEPEEEGEGDDDGGNDEEDQD